MGNAIPSSLALEAKSFINEPHRARLYIPLNVFADVCSFGPGASNEDKSFSDLKVGILLVESALPRGSVDTSDEGLWRPEISSSWRRMVFAADNPGSLIGCLILLENAINKAWLRPNAEHLLSTLPRPFKAVNEASVSSVALRLWILDRGLKYSYLD